MPGISPADKRYFQQNRELQSACATDMGARRYEATEWRKRARGLGTSDFDARQSQIARRYIHHSNE